MHSSDRAGRGAGTRRIQSGVLEKEKENQGEGSGGEAALGGGTCCRGNGELGWGRPMTLQMPVMGDCVKCSLRGEVVVS
jgi:hypothetical protein